MFFDAENSMMESLPHYRSKFEAAKKINVYYIPGFDEERNVPVYYYAIASAMLHEQMIDCLQRGDIPHFAVIVEKGDGEPTAKVKTKIRDYYGFDHDFHEEHTARPFTAEGILATA